MREQEHIPDEFRICRAFWKHQHRAVNLCMAIRVTEYLKPKSLLYRFVLFRTGKHFG